MVKIIDYIYSEAVKKLTAQNTIVTVSKGMLSLKTHSERNLYVYDILKDFNLLPDILDISKSENVSNEFRELGNVFFKKHQDYKALQYYNMSLLHAPNDSSQLCLAYSNRSAVLLSMCRYEECLKDIEKVLSMDYPDKIRTKLLNRKKLCLETNTDKTKDMCGEYIDKMMIPMPGRNPQYPCASSKLKVCYSKEMGRHVVATENIVPGEILAIEEPYTQCLLKEKTLFHCNRCFSFTGNLIPCDKCCVALFCGDECKEKAFKEYHSIECTIGGTLVAMNFTKLELIALRIVIKARSDHPNWQSLINLVQEADAKPEQDQTGLVHEGSNLIYDSKYYESIHSLATNVERRTASDIFQKCVTSAVLLHLLTKTDFFKDSSVEARKCAAGMLLQHTMVSPTNFHNISSTVYASDGSCVDNSEIGSAAYGFLSLLNHSCAPSVVRFTHPCNTTCTLVAIRKINKGSQIFDNYGYHHALQDRSLRRSSLKFQYKFDCACEACSDDWPIYLTLFTTNLPRHILLEKNELLDADTIDSLKIGCVETALKRFKPLCQLAKNLEDYVPCVEIGEVQEALKQCAFIMFGILPHGYSKTIDWERVLMRKI